MLSLMSHSEFLTLLVNIKRGWSVAQNFIKSEAGVAYKVLHILSLIMIFIIK